jgi:hypothetical protein
VDALAHVLSGHRADGGDLPVGEHQHRGVTTYGKPESEDGKVRHRVAYLDLTLSAPKHLSIAWAFAGTESERNSLLQAHRTARDETLRYIEQQAIRGRLGAGGEGGCEAARAAWITVDHFTARPTRETIKTDPETGEIYTELRSATVAGDMAVHSHCLLPDLIRTESGRFVAIDATAFHGHIHHFGAVYQEILARELTALSVGVEIDPRTNMARIPAIEERVVDEFSKRSREGDKAARAYAEREGRDWDALSGSRRVILPLVGIARALSDPGENTTVSPTLNLWVTGKRQDTLRLTADVLPWRPDSRSKLTCWPSLSVLRPACSTAEMWTKTSLLPSWGWMKPKPFWGLNHLTVPTAMIVLQMELG